MNLSKEEILKEIVACRQDPIYFIEKYGKVRHPIHGIVPFILYPFQKAVVKRLIDNRFIIIVKGRQLGLSTVMAAYAVWFAVFFNSKQILVLANKGEVATNFILKCKIFLKYVPFYMRPKITTNNRQSIELDNASIIKASTTTVDAARSEALSLLIVDEAAMIEKVEEVWTAARPTLATGGAAVVLSTPKGVGNWFHKKWIEAESGQSDQGLVNFVPIRLPWTVHPDRDEKWAETERKDLGKIKFAQEHETSFEKSGNTVVPFEVIDYFEKNQMLDPMEKAGFDNNLWIWKNTEYGKSYIVCGDVARGDGEDSSAAHVICVEDLEQVAEYKSKVPPDVFGQILLDMGNQYNNAMIICENNSIGYATIQKLLDAQYRNIYWSKKTEGTLFFDPLSWNVPGPDKIPGFTTSVRTRPLAIAALEEALRKSSEDSTGFIFHSRRLLDELKTFIWKNTGINSRAEALLGYNDDLVMALAIGLFARNTSLRINTQGYDQVNAMLSSISVESGRHSIEELSVQREVERKKHNQYKIPHIEEDLTWLIKD